MINEDNSKDNTKKFAENIYKKNKLSIFFKSNKKRLNYGGNIKSCLNFATKNNYYYAIMLHGDAQYHPKYIPTIIKKIEKFNCAAIYESRMTNKKLALKGNMPFYKFIENIILTKYFNFIYSTNFGDCHSGF